MSNQKLGVAIFAGLLIVTGIASSGRFFDANALLDRFMDRAGSSEEMAALPEGVEGTTESDTTEVESDKATNEADNNAEVVDADNLAVEQEAQEENAPAQATQQPAAQETVETNTADSMLETDQAASSGSEETTQTAETAQENKSNVAEESAASEPESSQETQLSETAEPSPAPPVFDLLRVEPNGDMVVAGVTTPGAEMELVAGSKTLAKTTANANGEFVAILDEALDPGDYEIVLRSTDSNGVAMTSAETAIVSIPEEGSNEVIALVEAPGEPSRLITITEAAPSQNGNDVGSQTEELAAAETNATQPADDSQEAASASTENETSNVETANLQPEQDTVSEPAVPEETAKKPIRIEAVEIDGPTVFVAGAAEPGTNLRIYANEILLGDTQATAQGRFLIEVNKELPVGDYIIRADALSSNGAEVVMRAAVPFTRSAGEKLAAVAVPATTRLPNEPPKIEQNSTGVDTPSVQQQTTSDSAAVVTDTSQGAAGAQPATESNVAANAAPAVSEGGADGVGIRTLDQPLRQVENSVVIRRGDTLWHISKRVYGQGIKYTTIYKANDDQIRDPDMIWPGQIFALPEEGQSENN